MDALDVPESHRLTALETSLLHALQLELTRKIVEHASLRAELERRDKRKVARKPRREKSSEKD